MDVHLRDVRLDIKERCPVEHVDVFNRELVTGDGDQTHVAVRRTVDFRHSTLVGVIDSDYRDKDAFIFSERISGRVAHATVEVDALLAELGRHPT